MTEERTDVAQQVRCLKQLIVDEKWRGWPDTEQYVAEYKKNIKNLQSGKWRLVRLTRDQYTLITNVLAPHREGTWVQIHPSHGVYFDLLHGFQQKEVDHLEFAPKDLPRWRELLDACKLIGYDPDLCDGLYNRLKRKASQS